MAGLPPTPTQAWGQPRLAAACRSGPGIQAAVPGTQLGYASGFGGPAVQQASQVTPKPPETAPPLPHPRSLLSPGAEGWRLPGPGGQGSGQSELLTPSLVEGAGTTQECMGGSPSQGTPPLRAASGNPSDPGHPGVAASDSSSPSSVVPGARLALLQGVGGSRQQQEGPVLPGQGAQGPPASRELAGASQRRCS